MKKRAICIVLAVIFVGGAAFAHFWANREPVYEDTPRRFKAPASGTVGETVMLSEEVRKDIAEHLRYSDALTDIPTSELQVGGRINRYIFTGDGFELLDESYPILHSGKIVAERIYWKRPVDGTACEIIDAGTHWEIASDGDWRVTYDGAFWKVSGGGAYQTISAPEMISTERAQYINFNITGLNKIAFVMDGGLCYVFDGDEFVLISGEVYMPQNYDTLYNEGILKGVDTSQLVLCDLTDTIPLE